MNTMIDRLLAAIPDFAPNREVAIHYFDAPLTAEWAVGVINTSPHVAIGESEAVVHVTALTLDQAIEEAIVALGKLRPEDLSRKLFPERYLPEDLS